MHERAPERLCRTTHLYNVCARNYRAKAHIVRHWCHLHSLKRTTVWRRRRRWHPITPPGVGAWLVAKAMLLRYAAIGHVPRELRKICLPLLLSLPLVHVDARELALIPRQHDRI